MDCQLDLAERRRVLLYDAICFNKIRGIRRETIREVLLNKPFQWSDAMINSKIKWVVIVSLALIGFAAPALAFTRAREVSVRKVERLYNN
jgi:hypothetical protein